MDLTQAPDNYLADLDRQLKAMEEEKTMMEQKYGFSDQFSAKQTIETLDKKRSDVSKISDYQHKERRYVVEKFDKHTFEVDTKQFKRMRPEISADWVVANKIKPDIMQFYDKKEFETQVLDNEEFQLGKEDATDLQSHDNYMQNFALL